MQPLTVQQQQQQQDHSTQHATVSSHPAAEMMRMPEAVEGQGRNDHDTNVAVAVSPGMMCVQN